MGYPVADRGVLLMGRSRPVGFFWQAYLAMATSHEDQPPPALRYSIFGEFDRSMAQFITRIFQLLQETAEGLTACVQFLQSRYVLHKHQIRSANFHQLGKVGKQRHPLIPIQCLSPRMLPGVGLTWRTPTEEHRIRRISLHPGSDCFGIHLADIRKLEMSIGKVGFEARSGIRVVIQRKRYLHSGSLKSAARPSAPGEEIIYMDSCGIIAISHV